MNVVSQLPFDPRCPQDYKSPCVSPTLLSFFQLPLTLQQGLAAEFLYSVVGMHEMAFKTPSQIFSHSIQ